MWSLAALISRHALLLAVVAAFFVVAAFVAPAGRAAEPTPSPPASGPAAATCADRFPAEGPAGVDLRLGCIVGELVGLYAASASGEPAPISTWMIVAAALAAGLAILAWVAARAVARRAGRRLAPVLPGTWWVCDRCRSVNAADARRCYACGGPPSQGPALPTSARPETPQSFGGSRRG